MSLPHKGHIQGPSTKHEHNDYERLQAAVIAEAGVDCSILILPNGTISIRTATYADYVLARACLRKWVGAEIVRDEL